MVKPFSPRELVARAKAAIARGSNDAPGERPLRFRGLHIDPGTRNVQARGKNINLTTREFDLLLLFARYLHRVFGREELLKRVWGREYEGTDRVVDVHVSNLRAKVEVNANTPAFIQTVRGAGYRFNATEEHADG